MVTMRVGGRYRLRNGEVWTCETETGSGAYLISSDRDSGKHCYSSWVDRSGGVYGDSTPSDYDVIAEVTDDATSEPKQVESDDVNHPKHYTSHPSGVECIAITEHFGFNVGNAIKYLWRAGLKTDDPITDLEKAAWYVAREIQRLKGGAT